MYLRSLGMKVKFLLLLSFIILVNPLTAQEKPKVYRPDIPGMLMIDYGAVGTSGAPSKFEKGWFGSRNVNVYYYFPFRLGQSKFTVNTGVGFGLDRFKFTNQHYLADTTIRDGDFELVPNSRKAGITYPGMRKSFLNMNYVDVPLELRFNLNPDDIARTFWVSAGARAGYLINANTKVKYKIDGETEVIKVKQRHGLSQFRYSASLRMGIGNFNWFGFYNLSPLFEKGKGPSSTEMTTFTLGISLTGL
jgi:hypothetical protein